MNLTRGIVCTMLTLLVAGRAAAVTVTPTTYVNINLGIDDRHGAFVTGGDAHASDDRTDFVTNEYTEKGSGTVDLAAGTIKGKQSALGLTVDTLKDAAQARVEAGINALVQVLGSPGVPAGTLVNLDLHALLNASFTTKDIFGPLSGATNDFVATFTIARPGFAASTKIEYDYHWHRVELGENFHHFHNVLAKCSTCTAEVVVQNPTDEFRAGFDNIDLHAIAPVRVGELYRLSLDIVGKSQSFDNGADGDWSHTASLKFALPEGVTLFDTTTEQLLTQWDTRIVAAPVPLPANMGLLLPAVLLLRRRR